MRVTGSNQRFSCKGFFVLLAAALSGVAGEARATIIAYDGVRASSGYATSGTQVQSETGLTGPTGWAAGAWVSGNSNITYQSAGGLTYSTAAYAGGGGIQFAPGSDTSRSAERVLSPSYSIPTPASGTNINIYASFMMSVGALDPDGNAYAGFTTSSGSGRGLAAGVNNGELTLGARTNSGLVPVDLGKAYVANTTYYFVLKLSSGTDQWGGTDPIELWVNPTDISSEAAMSSSSLVHFQDSTSYSMGVAGDTLNLFLNAQNFNGNTIKFDEFALGTTLNDVVSAVPEPSSFGLGAVALSALFMRRRTRRWVL